MRRRSFWGWGWEDEGPDPAQLAAIETALGPMLGIAAPTPRRAPSLRSIALPDPRPSVPKSLATILATDRHDRASHTYGKSYRDIVRGLSGDFSRAPDLVARPTSETDVVRVLDFCAEENLAAIPYGGGSSVCGGVEADVGDTFSGAVSIDMTAMNRVLEVDEQSRAARIAAGALGPTLEAQLRPLGLTLRHFPQSFEFSTLGGWIATRSGGHYATLYTHIDEMVESLRVVTPTGVVATRRLPGDGAGPSADRLFIGSEGALGIITEAWMRLQHRPIHRGSFVARFASFAAGARGVRALAQSGLFPSNCRLLDPVEAMLNGAGTGQDAVLIVGFESADHAPETALARAAECCRDANGSVADDAIKMRSGERGQPEGAAGAWRSAFIRMPYLRDSLVRLGAFTDTFETAVTWDRFDPLHDAVIRAARTACDETGGKSMVTCRVTHAYPDGAAPYFTVVTPAKSGDELAQWSAIKAAITDAMLEHGGTTTHHHAVGRDSRPWYDKQRPDGFARALGGAKDALDPAKIMNPGVLVPAP